MDSKPLRGRFAPTPSGLMHIGNARTALVAWLSIRSRGGTFVWRVEDLDPPRTLPGAVEAAMDDLRWLGIDWDEGPDVGGDYGPYKQSERREQYEAALERLIEGRHLFPCTRSRKELRDIARAPHGPGESPPYPKSYRPARLPVDWHAVSGRAHRPFAIRFCVPDGIVSFDDAVQGVQRQNVATDTGDFVLKRKDGLYAYQLAVVVDDIAMDITEVVRGADILDSTGRQILLTRALGAEPPSYAHVPLLLNADGHKLSKRDDSLTLKSLRESGTSPESIVGYLAWTLGLQAAPVARQASDVIPLFTWERVGIQNQRLPSDLTARLRSD